ncbi:MAG: riboflavin biosynthesis protein RibF [Vulcanimicrobiaceae bacterium]
MKIHHSLDRSPAHGRGVVMAIGFFDGVHRGHREILRALLRLRTPGRLATVLSFENHPLTHLRPGTEPPLITTTGERVNLLARAGIDELYLVPFDERIARLEWRPFLELLVERLGVRALVVGENFRFGAGREGDVAAAREFFAARGLELVALPPLYEAGDRISSTRVRSAIASGDVAAANRLLWLPYTVRGRVVLGEGRGHDLGFPTANLAVPPEKLIPCDGVYAVVVRYDGRDWTGLVSIGSKPTFGGTERAVEAWMLDFRETIYGEELALRDFRFIREQRAFAGVDELLAQMRADATHATFPSFL